MEATEQDLLATQKALEEEVQNKVKEAMVDNFLRVSSFSSLAMILISILIFKGKISSRREIYST